MLAALLVVLLAQVPCTPSESSVVCHCKQGMVSACVVLAGDDAKKAAEVLQGLVQAIQHIEEGKERERLRAAADALSRAQAGSEAPEPPDCKGQEHHPISRRIARRLEMHLTLKGLYQPRDPRFVARAKDEEAHCGYQEWHRKVDDEVIEWLDRNPEATPKDFIGKLREIYNRPEMRARFPGGF